MELWKKYREDIEKNISLQKDVIKSNEKLNILYNRLLKAFPEYEGKYKTELSKFEASISKVQQAPTISSDKILNIIDKIAEQEEKVLGHNSFENINFQSDELKATIAGLKEVKKTKIEYVDPHEYSDDIIVKTKTIKLGVKVRDYRIAIDGPSGSGKSTVAKKVAKRFGLKYINTGLVYRAIAFHMEEEFIDVNERELVISELPNIEIKILKNEIIELNGRELSTELRADIISQNASIVASYPEVRNFASEIQIIEGKRKSVVMDGRDTTFRIMPDADLKIFLDTSPEVRARRRVKQNEELGYPTDYDEILNEIKVRDQRDRNRKKDPLHKTEDAHLIDASEMTIDEVVEKISNYLK